MMLQNPASKYAAFPPIRLSNRNWPDAAITRPPVWLSTDLRDGNQALIEPMNPVTKLRFFELLVAIGFKEIEVGFPSASQADFDFVRMLIEENRVPDDVTIQVITQSREDLIRRTFESVRGARRAIVHLYNAISPAFRRIVFGMSREQVREIAVSGTRLIRQLAHGHPETDWVFQYSPETFSMAELDFSKNVCDAVAAVWKPSFCAPMIVNLPATVECATPNVFADQVEWIHRKLEQREAIVLSVHTHNDRGTGVAAAELALMAGAQRIEGCLFGNGERTGNVDLVTLALNLYTQGVHPNLDFSDIDTVRKQVEDCNQLPVHPRHPYAGDLVYSAFSGSHQDAIRKGFAQQRHDRRWEIPYLPIDPADLGRSYDAVVRVNSQSGKGGMAFLLEQESGLKLPRRMQIELSRVIQQQAEASGIEIPAEQIHAIFAQEYLDEPHPYSLLSPVEEEMTSNGHVRIHAELGIDGKVVFVRGIGADIVDALLNALDLKVAVLDRQSHVIGDKAEASIACFVELGVDDGRAVFGAAVDQCERDGWCKAVLSGLNRRLRASGNALDEALDYAA